MIEVNDIVELNASFGELRAAVQLEREAKNALIESLELELKAVTETLDICRMERGKVFDKLVVANSRLEEWPRLAEVAVAAYKTELLELRARAQRVRECCDNASGDYIRGLLDGELPSDPL